MSNVLLSLDVSTKTVGIAVFKYTSFEEKHLLHYEYYTPNKTKKSLRMLSNQEMLNMMLETRNYILSIAKKYNITEFAIEDYVRYMSGASAAATIIPLSVLNMTLRIAVLDHLQISPIALNVIKIRHAIKTDKRPPDKTEIPGLVAFHLGWDDFPWIMKTNRRTKESQEIEENYDMADAIAVGLAYILLKSRGQKLETEKKVKKRKRKK